VGDAAQSQLIESFDVHAYSLLLIFAAHRDGAGSSVAVLFAIVGASIAVIVAANKSENVVWRYRTYCPNCHRQVSPKSSRPHGCSFGYNLVQASCRPELSPSTSAEPANSNKFLDAAAARTVQSYFNFMDDRPGVSVLMVGSERMQHVGRTK
jgi:hypothetical protein